MKKTNIIIREYFCERCSPLIGTIEVVHAGKKKNKVCGFCGTKLKYIGIVKKITFRK